MSPFAFGILSHLEALWNLPKTNDALFIRGSILDAMINLVQVFPHSLSFPFCNISLLTSERHVLTIFVLFFF